MYRGQKGVRIHSCKWHRQEHEKDILDDKILKNILSNMGPAVIGIDASYSSFALYKSGLYFETNALITPPQLNHAVLLVGYGRYDNEHTHWKIKNSWGVGWGENGYCRVVSEFKDYLGISQYYAIPKL